LEVLGNFSYTYSNCTTLTLNLQLHREWAREEGERKRRTLQRSIDQKHILFSLSKSGPMDRLCDCGGGGRAPARGKDKGRRRRRERIS